MVRETLPIAVYMSHIRQAIRLVLPTVEQREIVTRLMQAPNDGGADKMRAADDENARTPPSVNAGHVALPTMIYARR